MTIDERIERLEHVTAAHIEQARQDYEENRRLWREQQADIAAIWQAMERRDRERDREWTTMKQEMDQRSRETDERFRETDRRLKELGEATDGRIGKLVTAIGELIERLPVKP